MMKITRTTSVMLAVVASIVWTGSSSAQDLGPRVKKLFPPLADQYAAATYKPLSDYRSDVRANPLMPLVAKRLTQTELAGVAVYFVSYREQNALEPCAAYDAHGTGRPPAAPVLMGQESHKDVYRRIGHISLRLSDDQMMRLGFFYAC
jgi:hypothetical protein